MKPHCPDCYEASERGSGKCPLCGLVFFDEGLFKTGFHPAGSGDLLFGRFDTFPMKRSERFESFRGVDCSNGKSVFIKRAFKPESGSAPDFDLLIHEAEVVSELDHPQIVKLFEIRRDPLEIVLVFDLAPGKDLLEITRADGPFSANEVRAVGLKLAETMGYLLGRGFIHNDLKPANIIWDGRDSLRLVDFGLAARLLFGKAGTDLRGTLPYMSPERIAEGRIGLASDIYSFGATLYHLAMGRPPFWKGDIRAEIQSHIPAKVRELRPSFPADLDEIILRCLLKNPKRRWADYSEIENALENVADEKPLSLREEESADGASLPGRGAVIQRILAVISEARSHLIESGDRSASRIVKDLENRILDWKLTVESCPTSEINSNSEGRHLIGKAEDLLKASMAGQKADIGTLTAEISRVVDRIKSRL